MPPTHLALDLRRQCPVKSLRKVRRRLHKSRRRLSRGEGGEVNPIEQIRRILKPVTPAWFTGQGEFNALAELFSRTERRDAENTGL